MKNESQYGLLLLQQYLYEHTDDQHPASVADVLAFWREHGIQAGRKSVYSAIEVLQSNGMDIVCVKSTQNRYFVGERLFELPELKLLVDAVESSRFITAKKSERLIEKLGKLTSESHARQLERHIYMDGTTKPENECIYYSVDEIHNAIQEKRQITFQYYEYTPQKEKILKHNGYRYQFSPYALIWSRDCYYAVGWSEKHGKLAQFRVDRMVAVESSDQAAVCKPDFDPAEYVRKIFGMYPDDLCIPVGKVYRRITSGRVMALGMVKDVFGFFLVAIPGCPMVKLALGTAREFQQFLPELLKEVEDTGDSGLLFVLGVTKGRAVDMDVQATGVCLMGQIPHLLGFLHDFSPRHIVFVEV